MKQRYLFAALFSAGVMIPMGFEFGFQKPLHVVSTRPADWESPSVDLTGFIRAVNGIKKRYSLFSEESITGVLGYDQNPALMLMWKASAHDDGQALLILNKDARNWQTFKTQDLYEYVQSPPPLVDISPEWPMDHLPSPFEFELQPGMGRVLVAA
jgi:starch synthase (maltosyl-transferring)